MPHGCAPAARKTEYLRDLAARFDSGALDAAAFAALDDESLIAELTQVKGIGRWSAMRLHYKGGRPLTEARMRKLGRAWACRGARSRRGICGAASTRYRSNTEGEILVLLSRS
jgi:hypothetical protein